MLKAIDLVKVSLTSLNPVAESMNAFREISSFPGRTGSAMRRMRNATWQRWSPAPSGTQPTSANRPRARLIAERSGAAAEADAIVAIADAVQEAPQVLLNMLWREKLETALAQKHKVIVPNQESLEKIALWKGASDSGAVDEHH